MEAAESDQSNGGRQMEEMKRPKRLMKTPQQLQVLERTYASEMYPSEEKRAELSEELGLSDRQLQMWFCHRRLKDKKDGPPKKPVSTLIGAKKGSADSAPKEIVVADGQSGHGSRSGSGSGSSQFEYGVDLPLARGYDETPQLRTQRAIACVEAQLGEPLRSDGPVFGIEFDVLPPGAFGAPIEMAEQRGRSWHSYEGELYPPSNFRPAKTSIRGSQSYLLNEASGRSEAYQRHEPPSYDSFVKSPSTGVPLVQNGNGKIPKGLGVQNQAIVSSHKGKQERLPTPSMDIIYRGQSEALVSKQMDVPDIVHSITEPVNSKEPGKHVPSSENGMCVEKKRKSDEVVADRQDEAQEKRIRKELEKQDILRHKREEQMRREMEKQERERRKEEERMMRERLRQQERLEREEKRENERREKFLQKESIKAERRRQKEELRREREEIRFKAALERATTRKLAKESMELIEDERLELMELAALSKGLPSIVSLDYDSLQNLESFRGLLRPFPPNSVQLKRPFGIQPWTDSDENIGNLFMAWKFCITFADVLGLWPFTLDEFVQAFHEHDSRLLGEIHIALLKLIIKDVEDVARTPSTAVGANQYSSANLDGGHPRIVEGAFLWGFNILTWKHNLNPLTWPEVMRQLALSAGFGPQLKKKSGQQPCLPENNEAKSCEDIVSTLRDGSAARSAFTLMREKGISLQRKSRHRVTPGTVKFAAYHVLCLEGSKGLTVVELANKIQKSGLRDLTTSKTPEASISVAMSRDTVIFERTAPSTYRVRTPFRKDPADAESVLSAAREKMKQFENGFLAGENNDDGDREEESDGEVSDSPEAEDFGTPDGNKSGRNDDEVGIVLGNKENLIEDVKSSVLHESMGTPINNSNMVDDVKKSIVLGNTPMACDANNLDQVDTEIDESKSGEPWVQGLAEGEYSDLSVEERLCALVALVGISNEGNYIRSILEDRLDAANALKKQMLAEAQLDKRRVKEETVTKFHSALTVNEAEIDQTRVATGTPSATADNGISESPHNNLVNNPSLGADNMPDHLSGITPSRIDSSNRVGPSSQQHEFASEKSRLQMKTFIGHKAEETYVYRSLPLGQDRRHNRYWQFVACASRNDPGSGRIFVESPDGHWRLIDSVEAFDALLESLDTRGLRESHLHMMLQKIEKSFKEKASTRLRDGNVMSEASEMDITPILNDSEDSPSSTVSGLNSGTIDMSSSFRIELGKSETEKKTALDRYQELQRWMWNVCFNSSTLCAMRYEQSRCEPLLGICEFCQSSYLVESSSCPSCYRPLSTFGNNFSNSQNSIDFDEKMTLSYKVVTDSSQPLRIRLLRALLIVIEVTVPSKALQSPWTDNYRKTWGLKLLDSMSAETLQQCLTEFESYINRDYLLRNYKTTKELLASAARSRKGGAYSYIDAESVPELPWVPKTTAAVALRLFELDGSIFYVPELKIEDDYKEHKEELPLRFTMTKTGEIMEQPRTDSAKHLKLKKNKNLAANFQRGSRFKRGGFTGRPRGRPQKRVFNFNKHKVNKDEELPLAQVMWQQGQSTHGQKPGRGRRTIRRPRSEKAKDEETLLIHLRNDSRFSVSQGHFGQENQNMQIDNNSNSVEASESDEDDYEDNNAPGFENGQWTNLETRETSDEDDDDDDNDGVECDQYLNLGAGNSREISYENDNDNDDDDMDDANDFEVNEDVNEDDGDDDVGDSEDCSD